MKPEVNLVWSYPLTICVILLSACVWYVYVPCTHTHSIEIMGRVMDRVSSVIHR